MKRLAIYAHFGSSPKVAHHVFFYLEKLAELGFQICFVSNSEILPASETSLKKTCARIIIRENTGLDFAMWQRGMAEYDLLRFDELLLTNSSIIGPLYPLAPLWQNPSAADCDFWGLTESNELWDWHLQSYFLVFKKNVLASEIFSRFWSSMLPYRNKGQIIRSYEIGLTMWLQDNGFRWQAIHKLKDIYARRSWRERAKDRVRKLSDPVRNSTLHYPDLLVQTGMPFVKAALLKSGNYRMKSSECLALLQTPGFPAEAFAELQKIYGRQ